ncbi:hypothetical protein A7985_11635 [Pseudoalteromonas luteoviolacea]|uniref:Uncharacterized protein n=1 Tax=Pseudoalteromonas luteoviolacea TaxID=43657 RepID=A0A1C0TQP3_9GAMM|nr:hypothetical protein [Pseudoalteromonas luteoviolacea]OCQ21271.1 hypothetical protein A7985_11635 [Pseudoalteromonas luteoviolacea]
MGQVWTEVQKDSYCEKYFKKIESLTGLQDIIGMVKDVFQSKMPIPNHLILNISFHFETSLIYIYLCDQSDLQEEVGVQVILQVTPFFSHFDEIKDSYDTDPKFNEAATKELILKYRALFDNSCIAELSSLGLDIKFFNYGWDCSTGSVTYTEN